MIVCEDDGSKTCIVSISKSLCTWFKKDSEILIQYIINKNEQKINKSGMQIN